MGDQSKPAQYHRARAEAFRSHADRAREVTIREMYLRLARAEEALADRAQQQLRTTAGAEERQEVDQPK